MSPAQLLDLVRADPADWCAALSAALLDGPDEDPTPHDLERLHLTDAQRRAVGRNVLACWFAVRPHPVPERPTASAAPPPSDLIRLDPENAEAWRALREVREPSPQAWIEGGPDDERQRLYLDAPSLHRLWAGAVHAAYDAKPPQDPPQHPLAPFYEAWAARPEEVEPNTRPDPLLPAPLVMTRTKTDPRIGKLNISPPGRVHAGAYLPGLAPGEPAGEHVAALPSEIYRLGGGIEARKGQGAPLAVRLFVGVLLDAPNAEGSYRLRPTARDLLQRVLADRPRPQRHFPALLDALAEVDGCRVPAAEQYWRPVSVTGAPQHIDAHVTLDVHLPPGSGRGFIVDRRALALAGANSSVAFRLELALAAHWHRPGVTRIPVARGRGHFRQARAPNRYPFVSDALLVAMAFPGGGYVGDPGRQLGRATKALRYLHSIGYVRGLRDRRLRPGPTWAGWGDERLLGDGADRAP